MLCVLRALPPGSHRPFPRSAMGSRAVPGKVKEAKREQLYTHHHVAVGICLANAFALISNCRALCIFQVIEFYQGICAYEATLKPHQEKSYL